MKIKKICIFGFILLVISTIPIIKKHIQENDLVNLPVVISNHDFEATQNILNKYPNDDRFVKTAIYNILEIKDEEIINLSEVTINQLIRVLKHIQISGVDEKENEIDSMCYRMETYYDIRTIDNKVNEYGYIECYNYLKKFRSSSNNSILAIEAEKQSEKLKNGVIREAVKKAEQYVYNDDLYGALYLLEPYLSWKNEKINQLYSDVKNKIAEKPKSQNTGTTNNVISVGMSQSEVLEICGEPNYTSNKGNAKNKNKGNFGTFDSVWHYSIRRSNKNLKFGVFFLKGTVVGISATDPETKLSEPVSVLSVS